MLNSHGDQVLHIFCRIRVNHTVSNSINLSVPELPNFLQAGSVRVHDSFPLHEGAPGEFLSAKFLEELMVDIRSSNAIHIFLCRVLIVQVRAQMLRNVIAELG